MPHTIHVEEPRVGMRLYLGVEECWGIAVPGEVVRFDEDRIYVRALGKMRYCAWDRIFEYPPIPQQVKWQFKFRRPW
jgi:hypothetical protein